jgi:L-ascorbate metabolism protein UlaG (beta-lactamase superfamily)
LDITYLGAGSVKLSGRNLNVVSDPYSDEAGLGKFTSKADVFTKSSLDGLGTIDQAMVIDGPGEYEVKGAMITGVPAQLHIDETGRRGTVYSIIVDGVNVVVTGNIAGKLDDRQLESLGNVDVLVLPVGGHGLTLDAEGAASVVAQLEPSYVIPVHYDDGHTKYSVPQDGVEAFLKEMGASPEPETKFKVNAKEMPPETQLVLLNRS